MPDIITPSTALPAAPPAGSGPSAREHGGRTWYWDGVDSWWPNKETLDYMQAAFQHRLPALAHHAATVRGVEVEVIQNRFNGLPIDPVSTAVLTQAYALMRQKMQEMSAPESLAVLRRAPERAQQQAADHARTQRNQWILAIVLVATPVLLMGGCAAKVAADDARASADWRAHGVDRCQAVVSAVVEPDTVTFSPTEGYGQNAISVSGDMVRTSGTTTTEQHYECSDRPVIGGGYMMHLDGITDR